MLGDNSLTISEAAVILSKDNPLVGDYKNILYRFLHALFEHVAQIGKDDQISSIIKNTKHGEYRIPEDHLYEIDTLIKYGIRTSQRIENFVNGNLPKCMYDGTLTKNIPVSQIFNGISNQNISNSYCRNIYILQLFTAIVACNGCIKYDFSNALRIYLEKIVEPAQRFLDNYNKLISSGKSLKMLMFTVRQKTWSQDDLIKQLDLLYMKIESMIEAYDDEIKLLSVHREFVEIINELNSFLVVAYYMNKIRKSLDYKPKYKIYE